MHRGKCLTPSQKMNDKLEKCTYKTNDKKLNFLNHQRVYMCQYEKRGLTQEENGQKKLVLTEKGTQPSGKQMIRRTISLIIK